HLKKHSLTGNCHHVFRLLCRLECPDELNWVSLRLLECVEENISEFLEPYLRDRIRRDDRFQGRLAMSVSHLPNSVTLQVDAFGEFHTSGTLPGCGYSSMWVTALFKDT